MNPTARAMIGATGLEVSRLGLGTAPLGGLYEAVDESGAMAVVEAAWSAGIRFFDTAPLYGYGLSERRLGAALRDKPRGEYVLATKVGRLLRAGGAADASQLQDGEPFYKGTPPLNPVFDFTYEGVMRSVEESLERLGLDRVDILHIHDPDDNYEAALEGAYRALARLRSEGTIGAVGAGMNQAQMLARFARAADFDCFLIAGRYTLLDQSALEDLLPLCADSNISVIAGGVFNSGILAEPGPGARFDYLPATAECVERAVRIQTVCELHDVPLKAAAIQFPLGHPAVTSVVVGCRSVSELLEDVEMIKVAIPSAVWLNLKADQLLPVETPTP